MRVRSKAIAKSKEPFMLNANAMLAILPNPSAAEIVFYAVDGQVFVMSFAAAGAEDVIMSITRRGNDHESVTIFERRLPQEEARHIWWQFCDGTIPVPGVLAASAKPAKRHSLFAGIVLLGLGLAFGGVAGWLVAGGGFWGSAQQVAVGTDEGALPTTSRSSPALASLGVTAPVAAPPAAVAPPVASSPVLAGAEQGSDTNSH